MDEPTLRGIISTMAKKMVPKFENASDPKCRMRHVLEELGYEKFVLELGLESEERDYPRKNEELARRNREDGNSAFQSGNHEIAILMYTEAMKYSPLNLAMGEGENMAISAANRSASHFALQKYFECLTDIELAVEAGYPTSMVHKLYIRQCRCLLELGRILEAQKAFDKAMDAIDRSGLKKDARKSMTVDLQEAFINLAKSIESNPPPEIELNQRERKIIFPEWCQLKETHPHYPAASSSIAIKFNAQCGRHVVATRDIEVGEIVFNEDPIVYCLNQSVAHGSAAATAASVMKKDYDNEVTTPACTNCLQFIKWIGGIVPCPTCDFATFCSIKCRDDALGTYHRYECRLSPLFERIRINRLPLIMAVLRAFTQRPVQYFVQENEKGSFGAHDVRNGETDELINSGEIYRSDDYKNLYHLVTHEERRNGVDLTTKYVFAGILLCCLKAIGYFDGQNKSQASEPTDEELLIGHLMAHFMQNFQFNMHLIESVLENRLIAPDSETRIWKQANLFSHGEFVETTPLGGGIYPTIANVNHSCDPNFTIIFFGKRAVAISDRKIKAGEEIHDSYGAVYYHMEKAERIQYLKGSHWFICSCPACSQDWPQFNRLPRDYLKLQGSHFKYKRCNRKELQKDVDKLKKKIKAKITRADENSLEEARKMYNEWMNLLDELLIVPGHQDFINVRRGMKNCMCLQSPNKLKVREDEALQEAKAKYKEKLKARP